jgi:hypothetical protein
MELQRNKGNNPSEPISGIQWAEEILTSRVGDHFLFEPPGSGSVIIFVWICIWLLIRIPSIQYYSIHAKKFGKSLFLWFYDNRT